MKRKIVIGIDIGGTNTGIGLVTDRGEVVYQKSIVTQTHEDINHYISDVCIEIETGKSQMSGDIEIVGMGIGAPNGNYYSGTIENAPNLRWKDIVPIVELFKKHFAFPIYITNDANAAAIGEMIFGGAKQMKNFWVVTLGTGLGSGIVVNGQLLYGHDGFAGELGHVTAISDGRQCNCGKKGCVETYVSATGVVRSVSEILATRTEESKLRDIPFNELSSKIVAQEAHKGDTIAIEVFDYTSMILGKTLADIVALTSPEAIFLFGGLTKAGSLIFDNTKAYMEENMMPIFKNKVKLLPSKLDSNAAIVGAAALALNEIK